MVRTRSSQALSKPMTRSAPRRSTIVACMPCMSMMSRTTRSRCAQLAIELQERLLRLARGARPEADLIVTQIDDRFDDRMRPFLGADTAALLPVAAQIIPPVQQPW